MIKKWAYNFADLFFPSITSYRTNDKELIDYIEENIIAEINCRRICNISLLLILIPFFKIDQLYPDHIYGFIISLIVASINAIFTIWMYFKIKSIKNKAYDGIIKKREYFTKLESIYWYSWFLLYVIIGFIRLNCIINGQFLYYAQLFLGVFPLIRRKKMKYIALTTIVLAIILTINLLLFDPDENMLIMIYFILINMVLVFVLSFIFQRLNISISVMTEYVKYTGFMDSLTNTFNRKGFKYILKEQGFKEIEAGIIMLDIDHFKKYNDTFGHIKGDEILVTIAKEIKNSLDVQNQLILRFGGEEFVICLLGDGVNRTKEVASKIQGLIHDLKICQAAEIGEYLTVSMGVENRTITPDVSLDELITNADKALYYAKEHGRNQICYWDDIKNEI